MRSLSNQQKLRPADNHFQMCYLYLRSFLHYVSQPKITWIESHFCRHPFFLQNNTHTHTHVRDGSVCTGWRLIPVADGSGAYNVIYRAGLTFQIQSGTLITDENLRQEITLIANRNLMRR